METLTVVMKRGGLCTLTEVLRTAKARPLCESRRKDAYATWEKMVVPELSLRKMAFWVWVRTPWHWSPGAAAIVCASSGNVCKLFRI